MDGIDAVLLDLSDDKYSVLQHYSEVLPSSLRHELESLCHPGPNEIDRSGQASVAFAEFTANTIKQLLKLAHISPSQVCAIGSHGQTIRHRPNFPTPFSMQIGNPSVIAHQTGITTVADFRMADMAAGGQGAPLVPAFHRSAFASNTQDRAIINIGGIANITALTPTAKTSISGYDIGPGNTLLDQWIQHTKSQSYDNEGAWARSGEISDHLLSRMLKDPFIAKEAPKSSGREYFNIDWLTQHTNTSSQPISPENIQRTLLELSAITISDAVKSASSTNRQMDVFICGGGACNSFLLERINAHLLANTVKLTDELGIPTQLVEAAAFAWLAQQTINHLHSNITSVTGARQNKILGGIYPA